MGLPLQVVFESLHSVLRGVHGMSPVLITKPRATWKCYRNFYIFLFFNQVVNWFFISGLSFPLPFIIPISSLNLRQKLSVNTDFVIKNILFQTKYFLSLHLSSNRDNELVIGRENLVMSYSNSLPLK